MILQTDNKITIYTDGSCLVNPGPGGWGALVLDPQGETRRLSGGEAQTTNNRMELTAPIMALTALKRPVRVELYTDSTYVRSGITTWVAGWMRNGWRTSAKQPVKNVDLWQQLHAACERHDVHWHWVKGHAGHAENERADQLASAAAKAAGRRPGRPSVWVCGP